MKNKGFTLVELLAVIVILAIILAVSLPSITDLIKNTTARAFEEDAKMVLKAIEYKKVEDNNFNSSIINETNASELLNLNNLNYQSLTIKEINGSTYITAVGKNKWNNLTASGTWESIKIDETVNTFSGGANKPALISGMTPIKWNGTAWIETVESDSDWYNYNTTDKKWANAKTADGSMWVWIPRYIYKISSGWHTATAGIIDVQFSKGVDDNWNKAVIGIIDSGETAESSNNKWTNHPAFTFGNSELTGIWVAKFEVSGTTNAIDIKPGVASLRSLTIGDMFTATRNMETNSRYGWGTTGINIDTHMIKNVEWGAVAYLAQSTYGKTTEITINSDSSNYTGGGSENAYSTNVEQSTTGTIYGIYDINGGSFECSAAYIDNGAANLNANGSSILNADSKYKDVYNVTIDDSVNNYANAIGKKGDAIYETSSNSEDAHSWYTDFSIMPNATNPWFLRSGYYLIHINAGSFFFYKFTGGADELTFRPTLLIGEGL